MKLLRVIDSIDPGTGGPIAGICSITPYLDQLGIKTTICSFPFSDDQLPESIDLVAYQKPGLSSWNYTKAIDKVLENEIKKADIVIIHGLWKYQSIPARKLCLKYETPYFVYPHGMLDPWFNKQYPLKKLKKRCTWSWNEAPLLRDATRTIFTSERESELASQSFSPYQTNPVVLPYGIEKIQDSSDQEKKTFIAKHDLGPKPFFLYLGRLHEKKNVIDTLKAYHRSKAYLSHQFVIAGECNTPSYQNEINNYLESLSIEVRNSIIFTGSLYGKEKATVYQLADAFILFSHQENFGLSIAEALSAKTPVMISKQVNIYKTIDNHECGLISEDGLESMTASFSTWIQLSSRQKQTLVKNAEKCFDQHFHIKEAAKALYQGMINILE